MKQRIRSSLTGNILELTTHFLLCLTQVDVLLRQTINPISLPALSAIVILNDTVLWTGNFGKRNASDPHSGPTNEYTIYR